MRHDRFDSRSSAQYLKIRPFFFLIKKNSILFLLNFVFYIVLRELMVFFFSFKDANEMMTEDNLKSLDGGSFILISGPTVLELRTLRYLIERESSVGGP